MPDALIVRGVPFEWVVDLRHRVLRPGMPRTTAVFRGDELASSTHVAALDGAALEGAAVVGCATFHASEADGRPAWQLRGMATDPAWCGRGVGRRVLEFGEAAVAAIERRPLWCNARRGAVGFYERLGWVVCSAEFDIPAAGPHVRMRKSAGG